MFVIIMLIGTIVTGTLLVYAAAKNYGVACLLFYTMFLGALALEIGTNGGEKIAAIQCLKGNNPYKMEIRYELKDSIYIPVDTVYIKIK